MFGRIIPAVLTLSLPVLVVGCADSPSEPGSASISIEARSNNGLAGESQGGITVPATGASDDGKFRGTITITGAGFNPQVGPVLFVRIRGVLIPDPPDDNGGESEKASLVAVESELNYMDQLHADDDCIELQISPPATVDTETKQVVEFDTSVLQTSMLPGPANMIADLICAIDEAVRSGWAPQEGPA